MFTRRTILSLGVVLLLSAGRAEAQSDVAFVLVPKIGNGQFLPRTEWTPTTGPFRPKYTDPGSLGIGLDIAGAVAMDYGAEPIFLLRISAITPEQRAALQAQADTLVVPVSLDNTVSALAVTSIQQKLESANLPADWVTTALTYRQVLQRFRRVMTFMQRWNGLVQTKLFSGGVTLDTRLNQLTAAQRQNLSAVSDSLGLDRSSITTTMTLRQAFAVLCPQLPPLPQFDGD